MVKVKISGELEYSRAVVDIEVDATGTVALIGPNLAGKSLVLKCIYSRAGSRIGRPARFPPELTCDVEGKDYLALYADAFRVVGQLYEAAVRERLEEIMQHAEFVSGLDDVNVRAAGDAIYRAAAAVEKILGDLQFALDAKSRADDLLVAEAVRLLDELYDELAKKAERARAEFGGVFDDFFPLAVSAVADGFVWTDRKAGTSGRGLQNLSAAYSPALVALYAIYAYAIPETTYLLVEEPEAHAHPLVSFFIGAYLRRLVGRSGGRLNVVVATHSFDFLRGFWDENTKVYVFRRFTEGGKVVLRVAEQWRGEGYVPGFSDVAIYKLI